MNILLTSQLERHWTAVTAPSSPTGHILIYFAGRFFNSFALIEHLSQKALALWSAAMRGDERLVGHFLCIPLPLWRHCRMGRLLFVCPKGMRAWPEGKRLPSTILLEYPPAVVSFVKSKDFCGGLQGVMSVHSCIHGAEYKL